MADRITDRGAAPSGRPDALRSPGGAPALLRLLTFTTLFPNGEQPNHGIFVENRLRHLVASGEAESVVVAPVPYFPSRLQGFGDWGRYARVAAREERHGLVIHHPRFPVIPRVGMSAAPALMAAALLGFIRRLAARGAGFDLIDAHYFYPDGVAALWIGQRLGCPVVITARGTDVNLIPRYRLPRSMIRRAVAGAAGLIAVSSALKQAMVDLGAAPERITVLRNGVDLALFRPCDRDAARRALGMSRPTLLSVGHLIERKGHDRVIAAMCDLPGFDLVIVGEGPERNRLEQLSRRIGVAERVRLLGAQGHAALPRIYTAADALVLASSREGWANVLLEAMACGTPVVASNAWGNPEVVRTREAGIIARRNTPEGLAEAVRTLFENPPARAAVRAYAEGFGWEETTQGQLALFRRVLGKGSASRSGAGRAQEVPQPDAQKQGAYPPTSN
ncbi:MAG TPA: glycosyltransferase family 4 protein [Stellaceae bacterium]|nr:glycosyltransferase family 4 protein [Stellaceae bacterium]